MIQKWCIRYRYVIFVFILMTLYAGYSISNIYGFSFFPDEFSYWAYAARAAGYDWTNVTSLGSYYSYGYSLILFPIFELFNDAVAAYRIAVLVNFLMICISYAVILKISNKLSNIRREENYIITAIAIFYPGVLYYARTTMVETMLASMYIIICGLMIYYLDNNKRLTFILLSVSLVYIHFLHMRSVGILIAGIVVLFISHIKNKKKFRYIIATVAIFAVIIAIGFIIKNNVQSNLYTEESIDIQKINDYAGQIGKIKYLFTVSGIVDFSKSLAGKILYMGLATFGLAYFGMAYLVKRIVKDDKNSLFYLFVILSTVNEMIVSSIYIITPGGVDGVVYGRYHEFTFPILILFGIYELIEISSYIKGLIGIVSMEMILAIIVNKCISDNQLNSFRGFYATGMSYLYNSENFEAVTFLWQAYLLGIFLTLLIIIIVRLAKLKKRELLLLILVIELICVYRLSVLYFDEYQISENRITTIVSKIEDLKRQDDNRRILFIPDSGKEFIGIIQFSLRDENIEILPVKDDLSMYTDDELGTNDILILFYENSYDDEAKEKYKCGMLKGYFYIYYNT